jgi:formylglycine-generating enzyme required for sulfatase activity
VAEVRAYLAAVGKAAPLFNAQDADDRPAVGLSFLEAVGYARRQAMRLPTEEEWLAAAHAATAQTRTSSHGVHELCGLWEWTTTAHKGGRIVRGGRYRDRPEVEPATSHRSWDDTGGPDIALRLVLDGEPS